MIIITKHELFLNIIYRNISFLYLEFSLNFLIILIRNLTLLILK